MHKKLSSKKFFWENFKGIFYMCESLGWKNKSICLSFCLQHHLFIISKWHSCPNKESSHLGEDEFTNALCQGVKVDSAATGLSLGKASLSMLLGNVLTDRHSGFAAL